MFKGYKPFNGNGVNTENTDPIKKNAKPEGVMTTGGQFGNVKDRNLSPQYEKQNKKDLLASNLDMAKKRLDAGQLNPFQYNQRVDALNSKYKTFDYE